MLYIKYVKILISKLYFVWNDLQALKFTLNILYQIKLKYIEQKVFCFISNIQKCTKINLFNNFFILSFIYLYSLFLNISYFLCIIL